METVRIDAPLLTQYKAKHVRVLGKVTSISDNNATIDANGEVKVTLESASTSAPNVDEFVDIVGVVQDDLVVRALQLHNTKQSDLNTRAVNEMVNVWHKFPQLFYNK